MSLNKWDRRFLELAAFVSQWSKDPSTKTGAVIVDPENRIVSVGFNGLPRGLRDTPDRLVVRDKKLSMIVHCEMNAMIFAPRSTMGCTLYTYPFLSCSSCASMMVQAGIKRAVAPVCTKEPEHWMHESLKRTRDIFNEAGVEYLEDPLDMMVYVVSGKQGMV